MKNLYITLILAGLASCLVGCSKQDETSVPAEQNDVPAAVENGVPAAENHPVETIEQALAARAAAEKVPVKTVPWQWQERLEPALEQAKSEGKMVLMEFTGSDWCPPCKLLKTVIFPSEKFVEFARDKFIFVEIDFPRMKQLSEETRAYNDEKAKEFDLQGVPAVVIFDGATGLPIAFVPGASNDAAAYLANFQNEISNGQAILAKIAAARENGVPAERAAALAEALKSVPARLAKFYANLEDEIIAADPDDSLGMAAARAAREREAKQMDELRAFEESLNALFGDVRPGDAKFPELVGEALNRFQPELAKEWLPLVRQKLLMSYSFFVAQTRNWEMLEKVYREAAELAPDTREGRMAAGFVKNFPEILADIKRHKAEMKAAEEAQKSAGTPAAGTDDAGTPAAVPVKSENSENSEISENSEDSENSEEVVPAVVPEKRDASPEKSVPAETEKSVPAEAVPAPVAAIPLHK